MSFKWVSQVARKVSAASRTFLILPLTSAGVPFHGSMDEICVLPELPVIIAMS